MTVKVIKVIQYRDDNKALILMRNKINNYKIAILDTEENKRVEVINSSTNNELKKTIFI